MKWIQSPENILIKNIKNIKKKSEEKIFIEGVHLIETALISNYVKLEKILVTEQFIKRENNFFNVLKNKNLSIIGISEQIAKIISDTVTPQGIFAVASFEIKNINALSIKTPTLIVIVDKIQDPGNFGTIIRASEALGVDAIFFTPGSCNPVSTKVLRASAGSIFFIPVIKASIKEVENFISKNRLNLVITDPSSKKLSFEIDFTKRIAIAFGNESQGVTHDLRTLPHISCRIPHIGKTQSLNVAMSAVVFLYEILRQRASKILKNNE